MASETTSKQMNYNQDIKYDKMKKVVVGLSGGVDSAVTALLLKEQGHNVLGVFMQNWEVDNDDPHCLAEQDLKDAKAVADHIGIPFETVNFAKEYWQRVFQYCLDEFSAGRTPNPDVLCNREIKFKAFLEYALNQGADYLATGHYAKVTHGEHPQLHKAIDTNKDQTYFLHALGEKELSRSLFPLGELEKSDVRKIAETARLPNFDKKDSTGLCFIGERKFKTFLNEFLLAKPGEIRTPEGEKLGKHDGLMFYTLGQRKGLNIGGQKNADQDAWYVLDKDIENNRLIVGQGHDHPLLYTTHLTGEQPHWISGESPMIPFKCHAKTRYRQADQACTITAIDADKFEVSFEQAQRAITPGQYIVFYAEDICLGGGTIDK